MNNKNILIKELEKLNYTLGCYNPIIDTLPKKELNKIIDNLKEAWTDINVKIKNKEYVVELATVEYEKDFDILTKKEYIKRYGN